MKSAKSTLLTMFLVVGLLLGISGCGGDSAASPTATTAPVATATSTVAVDTWQAYTSTEGKYKVSMPGKPKETNQTSSTDLGDITNYFTKYQDGDDQYVVSYGDYPLDAVKDLSPVQIVEQGFSKTFEASPDKTKVISKKQITVKGFPGMEGEIEYTSGNYVWYKEVLVNNRIYQLIATTPTDNKDKLVNNAKKFHESFEFEAPAAAAEASTPTAEASTGSTDGWQTVTSAEGNFSVLMPGTPEEKSSASQTAVGEITQHLFQYAKNGPEYVIAYADYPSQTSEADPVKLLEDTIKGAAQGSAVLNQQASTVEGNASVSGEWDANGVSYTWYKAILVKDRLYQLAVATSSATKDQYQADAQKFIDSFKLNP